MFPDPSPYELVIDTEDWCVSWDSHHGVYLYYTGISWSEVKPSETEPEKVMWPSLFTSHFSVHDGREQPYLFYQPDSTYEKSVVSSKSYRNHFVQDGETICRVNKRVPKPYSEEYTPLSEMTDEDWIRAGHGPYMSNICSHCSDIARRKGLYPESDSD
jgi:hypothetical protein